MIVSLIQKLTGIPSVSGFEGKAVELFIEELKNICSTYKDKLGNGYASLSTDQDKPVVIITAHVDEIGFQVSYIDENGYLFLRANGGVDNVLLPGSQVIVTSNKGESFPGIIGRCPIHLIKPDDRGRIQDIDSLWVDTGMSVYEVQKKIHVGDTVTFAPNLIHLGKTRISSKGLDNKVGVGIIISVMREMSKKKLPFNLVAVASTREELGAKSANAIVNTLKPTMAICIDMGFTSDVPDISPKKVGDIRLGKGPILVKNADSDPDIVDRFSCIAQKNKIPHQTSTGNRPSGDTDAANIKTARTDIQTMLISIPCRYMHSQVEMCDLNDISAAIELIKTYLYNEQ